MASVGFGGGKGSAGQSPASASRCGRVVAGCGGAMHVCLMSLDQPLGTAPRAPFAPGASHAIDSALCRRLLSLALSQGADYADVFFEYRVTGGLSFEEGITRSAARGVSLGVGIRALKGNATGYAFVEDLSWEALQSAACHPKRWSRW
jgi:PmbA/TldA metallopeptidase domain 1